MKKARLVAYDARESVCVCVCVCVCVYVCVSVYVCGSFLRKVYQKCDMGLQKSKLLFLTVFCGI